MNLRTSALTLLAAGLLLSAAPAAASSSDLQFMLSARHLEWNAEVRSRLESAAGSKQALVDQLIEFSRSDDVPSPVAMRSAHILANEYVDDPEVGGQVLRAMEEDIADPNKEGLARLYASKVERITDRTAKRAVAAAVADRGAVSTSFKPYAERLLNSNDSNVRSVVAKRLN